MFNQGTEKQVKDICESIKNFVSENCGKVGQTYWLKNNYDDKHVLISSVNVRKHINPM